jgi:hypothetical protein
LRRRSPDFGPRGELPSSSLLLSLPLPPLLPLHAPSLFPARARPCPPRSSVARPRSSPGPRRPTPSSPCPRRQPPPRPLLARGGAPPPCSPGVAPAWPPAPGAALGGSATGAAPGAAPGAAQRGPRRGLGPLRAASHPSAWLAWPWRGLALPRLPLTRSRVRKPARAVTIS